MNTRLKYGSITGCVVLAGGLMLSLNQSDRWLATTFPGTHRLAPRDLNKNGKLDPYEDPAQPMEARITDLLKQMTLEEKAGTMFINGTVINDDGTIDKRADAKGPAARMPSAIENISDRKMTHFNLWAVPATRELAIGTNAIQKLAESTRLGIPVTIASDPRHYFSTTIFCPVCRRFFAVARTVGFCGHWR